MRRSLVLLIALSCFLPMVAVAKDNGPSPDEVVAKSLAATDIWSHGPLMIIAKVRFLRMKNGFTDFDYVLYWQGPELWRSEWRGAGVTDVRGVRNGISWTKTNLQAPIVRVLQFDEAMRRLTPVVWPNPFGDPTPPNVIPKYRVRNRKVKAIPAVCLEQDGTTFGSCFNADNGTPLTEITNLANITYSDYADFKGTHFPKAISISESEAVLEAKLEVKAWQPDPSQFQPPEGAVESAFPKCEDARAVVYGKSVEAPPPHYPSEARVNGQQGKVVVYAFVGIDGRVKNLLTLQSPTPALDTASFEAVRQWRYEPSMRCGSPIEVEFPVVVNYALPRE